MENTSSSDLCELFFFWCILPIKLCLSLSSLPPWVTSLFTPHPVPLLRNLRVTLPLLHPTAILDPSIASPSLPYCFSKGLMGPVLAIFRPSYWHQNGPFNMWLWSLSLLVCKPPMDSSPPWPHLSIHLLVPSTPQSSSWKGPLSIMLPSRRLVQLSGTSSLRLSIQEALTHLYNFSLCPLV